jgi:hypothetical protein
MDPEGRRVLERDGNHFFCKLYQIYIKTTSSNNHYHRRSREKNLTQARNGTEMIHLEQNCVWRWTRDRIPFLLKQKKQAVVTIHGWKVLASYSRGSALWSHFECPWGHQERWRQFDAHQQTGHTPDTEPQSLDYHLPLNAIPYCILKPDLIQQRQTIHWLAHLPFKGVNSSKYYTSTEFLPHSKHMSSPLQRQTGNKRSRSPVI